MSPHAFDCRPAGLGLLFVLLLSWGIVLFPTAAPGTNLIWDAGGSMPPNGVFNALGNWNDNTQFPEAGDTATFNINNTYTVTFPAEAASDSLAVVAGIVNFRSDTATVRNYDLITGVGNVLLNGGTLNIGSSALPVVVNAANLLGIGTVAYGAIGVDGAGSALIASGPGGHFVGSNGFTGTLSYVNAATGSIDGTLGVGITPSPWTAAGNLNVLSNADLTVANLNIGTDTSTAGTGTVTVADSGSTLTMTGASLLNIGGSATGNFGILNVINSGSFNTGTGAVTVNPGGDINIGGGTLNLNGDTLVEGGAITRTGGTLNLAAGRRLTAQNGAQINFVPTSALSIDTTWNINSGADLVGSGTLAIGTAIGTTNVTVDGAGSSLQTGMTSLSTWGANGGTANVTIRNGATATTGLIDLAFQTVGTITGTINIQSGATMTTGNLRIAYNGGVTTSGTINVDGMGSMLTQNGASTLTVGHSADGTAAINIGTNASGGEFHTGTGLFTINRTGTVTIGSGLNTGLLDARGEVMIDGGVLVVGSGSLFTLAANRTITITNDGRATWSDFIFVFDNTWNVIGTGSRLEFADVAIGAADFTVSGGGLLSSEARINIGTFFEDTTLSVDGDGSSVTANSLSSWGGNGYTTTVTFSDNAIGTFAGGLQLIGIGSAGSVVNVTVQSAADLTVNDLFLNTVGGDTTGSLTITDIDSTVTVNNGFSIGHATSGVATLNVNNGGSFTVGTGGSTTLNATGVINIDSGTADLKAFTHYGGTINFVSGSLSLSGDLTIGPGGPIVSDLTLGDDHQLTLTGTTTIDPSHDLVLNGGTLSTGTLAINGTFVFNRGTLTITQAGASINSRIVSYTPDATININANNVSLGDAASLNGFYHQGTLNVGANTVTLNSAGYARLGVLTTLNSGTINAPNGVTLPSGANLRGKNGTVNARVTGELGSVIEAYLGSLTLGDAASPAGFNFAGELRTRQFAVTLNSSAQAGLGNLTTLGSGASPGTLNVTNGLVVDFGDAITGFGTINSTNSLAKRNIINGTAQGNSVAEPLTFTGYVKGVGTFDNVTFTGTFDPGLSSTILPVGNIALSSTSTLIMELGGTTPGSGYDQIQASGTLALDGTLDVELLGGFTPAEGNVFEILTADGGVLGTFANSNLPFLSSQLTWQIEFQPNSVILQVLAALLTGDMDCDGDVDFDDIDDFVLGLTDLAAYEKQFGVPPSSKGDTDDDGDQDFDDIDGFVAILSGQLHSRAEPVPEPTTWGLVLACLGLLGSVRLRPLFIARRRFLHAP